MRAVLLVVILAFSVVIWTVFVRQVRAVRRGHKMSTGFAVGVSVLVLLSILGVGFSIGYAIGNSASGGAIGLAITAVAIVIVGPLVRLREAQRRAAGGPR